MIVKRNFKRGIAMIELIFALVIMGIALLSAPMLIQQSIKSSNVALQQESIAALASHTGILLSKYWDEADSNYTAGVAPIITLPIVGGGGGGGGGFPSPFSLAGIDMNDTNVSGRTSTVGGLEVMLSALGQDKAGDFNDVDDYNNIEINVTVFNGEDTTSSTLGDYIDLDLNITTNVTFANDRPNGANVLNGPTINAGNTIFSNQDLGAGVSSNIKFIQTRLTSNSTTAELQKDIRLKAFSCNLGSYSLVGAQYE